MTTKKLRGRYEGPKRYAKATHLLRVCCANRRGHASERSCLRSPSVPSAEDESNTEHHQRRRVPDENSNDQIHTEISISSVGRTFPRPLWKMEGELLLRIAAPFVCWLFGRLAAGWLAGCLTTRSVDSALGEPIHHNPAGGRATKQPCVQRNIHPSHQQAEGNTLDG